MDTTMDTTMETMETIDKKTIGNGNKIERKNFFEKQIFFVLFRRKNMNFTSSKGITLLLCTYPVLPSSVHVCIYFE